MLTNDAMQVASSKREGQRGEKSFVEDPRPAAEADRNQGSKRQSFHMARQQDELGKRISWVVQEK